MAYIEDIIYILEMAHVKCALNYSFSLLEVPRHKSHLQESMMGFRRLYVASRFIGMPKVGSRSMSSNFIVVGDDSAFKKLEGQAKQVYYFTASWCPPCKMIGPVFEKMAPEFTDIQFLKIDVDEVPDAAQKHGVRSVPTFKFVRDGLPEGEVVGADEGSIRNELEKLS